MILHMTCETIPTDIPIKYSILNERESCECLIWTTHNFLFYHDHSISLGLFKNFHNCNFCIHNMAESLLKLWWSRRVAALTLNLFICFIICISYAYHLQLYISLCQSVCWSVAHFNLRLIATAPAHDWYARWSCIHELDNDFN